MTACELIAQQLIGTMSRQSADDLAQLIEGALTDAGLLVECPCTTVEVGDARPPVETIEAYGLTLALDANGEAAEISHRSGLVVVG